VVSRQRIAVPRGVGVAAAQVADGQRAVAAPRDAATLILLRPADDANAAADAGDAGLEVLLLCRTRAMDFAPGAYVYPGGSVDPRDADADIGWTGRSAAEFSELLDVPPERSRALVCAAVRETFEESGVLLAGEPVPADVGALTADRQALLDGALSLGDLLARHGLALRADLLIPWTRWITPEAAERRYDTWFFVAAMPDGQVADAGIGAGPEADSAVWLRPSAALDAARAGEITLLPPTAVTLASLAAYRDVADVLAQRPAITPLMPSVSVEDGRAWLTLPDGVEYPL
jgi:8-oxo-dGTP pyrophosphatase MutT (NUDIX family)